MAVSVEYGIIYYLCDVQVVRALGTAHSRTGSLYCTRRYRIIELGTVQQSRGTRKGHQLARWCVVQGGLTKAVIYIQ
jgi:hypothetical protein